MKTAYLLIPVFSFIAGCVDSIQDDRKVAISEDTAVECPVPLASFADSAATDSLIKHSLNDINTRDVQPEAVVAFAHTLQGVPYKYASTDPKTGFDCSGFITYVFNHFKIDVPRSSVDFTDRGKEVAAAIAQPGDLILFTGTDRTIPVVGHMGIVTNNEKGNLSFIHSTSGKAYGVTVTPLNGYYKSRFVKVIRVFPEEYIKNENTNRN